MSHLVVGTDVDNNVQEFKADKFSRSQVSVSLDHSRIHDGDGFHITTNFASVANNGVSNIIFKTPASGKTIHMKYKEFWTTGAKYAAAVYEKPTNDPTGGTDLNVINRNRLSTKTTSMQLVKHTATIDTTGATQLDSIVFGGNSAYRPLDLEFILKADTFYILTMTNLSGSSADINAFVFWYEN